MGTGYGSAGPRRVLADPLFLGNGVQRPLLRGGLDLDLGQGQGWGLGVGWRLSDSLQQRGSRQRWGLLRQGVEVSLGRLRLGLGLRWGVVERRRGLDRRRLLDLWRLVDGVVLELRGGRSVLAEATGLSCTVDLTQGVQGLALGVFQQVGLALKKREREREGLCQQRITST